MELISVLEYKGYTIKTFKAAGSNTIRIFLGDEPIDYTGKAEEHYDGTIYDKEGIEAAQQYIDELEEKENSL